MKDSGVNLNLVTTVQEIETGGEALSQTASAGSPTTADRDPTAIATIAVIVYEVVRRDVCLLRL